jgi:RNA polymerase sigma factor (sigma-70 family)
MLEATMATPPKLSELFTRPGSKWQPCEVNEVLVWVCPDRDGQVLPHLLLPVAKVFENVPEALDFVYEFIMDHGENILRRYDPAKIKTAPPTPLPLLRRALYRAARKRKRAEQSTRETAFSALAECFHPEYRVPEDRVELNERQIHELREAVKELPDELRQVVEERFFAGKRYKAISKQTKIPVLTLRKRFSRAKSLLQGNPRVIALMDECPLPSRIATGSSTEENVS